jgi:large subunit ribosomal protein L12e
MSKNLAGIVKEIQGSAHFVGCTVDGQDPHDIINGINDGKKVKQEASIQ